MSITNVIARGATNYNKNKSLGFKLRKKRLELLLPLINDSFEKYGAVNIVDVGGTKTYWNILDASILEEKNVHITIVNLPGSLPVSSEKHFSYVEGDACNLSMFEDKSYHISHSNSVVEHVGDWARMVQFAQELSRVSEKYFVQTPNFWFPIEPHCMTPFFQWLPKPTRIWLVMKFQLGHWKKATNVDMAARTVEGARLLNRGMFQELFKDGHFNTERFIGFPKSHIAVKS